MDGVPATPLTLPSGSVSLLGHSDTGVAGAPVLECQGESVQAAASAKGKSKASNPQKSRLTKKQTKVDTRALSAYSPRPAKSTGVSVGTGTSAENALEVVGMVEFAVKGEDKGNPVIKSCPGPNTPGAGDDSGFNLGPSQYESLCESVLSSAALSAAAGLSAAGCTASCVSSGSSADCAPGCTSGSSCAGTGCGTGSCAAFGADVCVDKDTGADSGVGSSTVSGGSAGVKISLTTQDKAKIQAFVAKHKPKPKQLITTFVNYLAVLYEYVMLKRMGTAHCQDKAAKLYEKLGQCEWFYRSMGRPSDYHSTVRDGTYDVEGAILGNIRATEWKTAERREWAAIQRSHKQAKSGAERAREARERQEQANLTAKVGRVMEVTRWSNGEQTVSQWAIFDALDKTGASGVNFT